MSARNGSRSGSKLFLFACLPIQIAPANCVMSHLLRLVIGEPLVSQSPAISAIDIAPVSIIVIITMSLLRVFRGLSVPSTVFPYEIYKFPRPSRNIFACMYAEICAPPFFWARYSRIDEARFFILPLGAGQGCPAATNWAALFFY